MIFRFTRFWVVVAVVLQVSVSVGAPGKTAPADPSAGTAKLTFDDGRSVTCLTPDWAEGGERVQASSSTAKAEIGGKSVTASGWVAGEGYQVGLDANGDGIVNSNEYRNVAKTGSTILIAKSGKKQVCVRCTDIHIHYDKNKKEVTHMRWRMQGVYGRTGKIGSVPIRILDENLDGEYKHNGQDAICIGKAKLAVPLRRRHRIGEHFYELKISEDGSSLEYKPLEDPKPGLVRAPMSKKFLLGLVLEGANGAYDIQECSRTGIPSGTYKLVYGAIGDPRSPMAVYSERETLKYKIQADKTNFIRMGQPLQLVFHTGYHEDKNKTPATRRIRIGRPDKIMGAGGEVYGPVRFPNARSRKARPSVAIMQGGRFLVREVMPERDGKIHEYSWEVPRKKSIRGIRVAVAIQTRALGRVVGTRTIRQIVAKEKFAPPKSDKPSVITSPWRRSAKRPKRVKPKPSKGKGEAKPTTRPATVKPKTPVSAAGKEQTAQRLVQLARSYDRMKLRAKAIEKLKQVVAKYPDTKAAGTARKLLDKMQ